MAEICEAGFLAVATGITTLAFGWFARETYRHVICSFSEAYVRQSNPLFAKTSPSPLRKLSALSLEEREHACGSQSHVRKATCDKTTVAIKFYKQNSDYSSKTSFQLERAMLEALSHPAIISIKGAICEPKTYGIILEFMAGGTLKSAGSRIARDNYKLIQAARDIMSALTYIHMHDITHGDVIASNILLDDDDLAKLGDFGLSQVVRSCGFAPAPSGYVFYQAPPEMWFNNQKFYPASDIYMFGRTFRGAVCNFQMPMIADDEDYSPQKLTERCGTQGFFQALHDCDMTKPHERPRACEIELRLDTELKTLKPSKN